MKIKKVGKRELMAGAEGLEPPANGFWRAFLEGVSGVTP